MIAYYPAQDYGVTPEGHPVFLDHFPLSDPNAVITAFGVDEVVNYHTWVMERQWARCEEESNRTGRPVTSAIFVFNMNGLQCLFLILFHSLSFSSETLSLSNREAHGQRGSLPYKANIPN